MTQQGSIVPRNGRFYIVYRVGGKQIWRAGGRTETEARNRLDKALGRDVYMSDMPLEDFADDWLRSAKLRIKESTYECYRCQLNNHIKPYFGSKNISKVTFPELERFVDTKIKEGYAPGSINKMIVILKIIFKRALRYKVIGENPAEYLTQLTIPKKVKDFLRPAELSVLLEVVKSNYPDWQPFFMIAVFTGARIGELLALRWSDINWDASEIRFAGSVYRGKLTTTKTNTIGMVRVPAEVLMILKSHPKTENQYDLIFTTASGRPIDRNNVTKRIFKKALAAAGLRDIKFHSLRDSYNVLMLSSGANIKVVQDQLRHKNINMTLETYGHSLETDKKRAVLEIAKRVLYNENVR